MTADVFETTKRKIAARERLSVKHNSICSTPAVAAAAAATAPAASVFSARSPESVHLRRAGGKARPRNFHGPGEHAPLFTKQASEHPTTQLQDNSRENYHQHRNETARHRVQPHENGKTNQDANEHDKKNEKENEICDGISVVFVCTAFASQSQI